MWGERVYVIGGGAIGMPLALHLSNAGCSVVVVRTSGDDVPRETITATVSDGASDIHATVDTIALSESGHLDGIIVVATKSYANESLARALAQRITDAPVVLMQNGVGVERPFLEAEFGQLYRCVLYVTSQRVSRHSFDFRPIASSPIGIVRGHERELESCTESLSTDGFPLHLERDIQPEIWKKAIINAVFNSVCPLLDTDNGVFARDQDAAAIAAVLVCECLSLTDRLGIELDENDLVERITRISKGSDGQFISTLQDIQAGRPTEIETLNLEMARMAADLRPRLALPRVELLGRLILAKSGRAFREPGGHFA